MTDKKIDKPKRAPDVESFNSEATTREGVTKTTKLYRPTEAACEKFDLSYTSPPIFGSAVEVRAFLTERRAKMKAEAALEKRRVEICEELTRLADGVYAIVNSGKPLAAIEQRCEGLGARLSDIRDAFHAALQALEPVPPPKGEGDG